MRYDSDTALLELDPAELAGAISALGVRLGPIAPGRLGGGDAAAVRAFEDGLAVLPDEARDLLESALGTLADPKRSLKVHALAGEDWLHRAVYAWSDAGIAMLATRAGTNVLGAATAEDIASVLTTPLFGGSEAVAGDVRLQLDGRAAIALVGAGDALRFGRMAALTRHMQMPEGITAAEVSARLTESTIDDPRWTANLYASVLPFDAAAWMDAPTTELAMQHLAGAGLFTVVERSGAMPAHYHPTDEGLVALDTLANAGGRVALTLFEQPNAQTLAYESILLARGQHMLAMLSVAPEGAGLVALSTSALTTLVSRIAGD